MLKHFPKYVKNNTGNISDHYYVKETKRIEFFFCQYFLFRGKIRDYTGIILFLYSPKKSEHIQFSDVFRGHREGEHCSFNRVFRP